MAAEANYDVPDSDDEMLEVEEVDEEEDQEEYEAALTPQEWKSKADDLYKVRLHCRCFKWAEG